MERPFSLLGLVLMSLLLGGCGPRLARTSVPGEFETGRADYYSDSLHGKKTASGELYDKGALTAAHRELPFGTVIRVTSLVNRRSVQLRVNDRGPSSSRRRIVVVSREAAELLGMVRAGVVEVRVELVSSPEAERDQATPE